MVNEGVLVWQRCFVYCLFVLSHFTHFLLHVLCESQKKSHCSALNKVSELIRSAFTYFNLLSSYVCVQRSLILHIIKDLSLYGAH